MCYCGDVNCTGDGVDYHTQIPSEPVVLIRNRYLVEAVLDGKVTAKAVRAEGKSWQVGAMIAGNMHLFCEIYSWVPEVLGRKMVLAILKEIG